METLSITLAGQEFRVQPFTVGQLQDLHIGTVQPVSEDLVESTRKFWDRNIAILAIALRDDHPNMTEEVIRKMRLGTITAVKKTVEDIMCFSGIWVRKDSSTGEAPAATE